MEANIEHDEPLGAAFPVHPGLVLKLEVLPARKVTGVALAEAIHAERAGVTRMLNGMTAMTAELALKIEAAIGYPAELLLRLQANYDLARTRREKAEMLAAIAPIAA